MDAEQLLVKTAHDLLGVCSGSDIGDKGLAPHFS